MKNNLDTLKEIGLTEKESRIYLALRELGQGTAYSIAKISHVKQPTVYVTLESLKEKGLILKIPHVKKQVFIAKDLSEYIQNLEDSLNTAKKVNERLSKLRNSEKASVSYFEGLEGVKDAIYYRLDEFRNETLLHIYGPLDLDVKRNILKEYMAWNRKSLQKNIKQKILISPKDVNKFEENMKLTDEVNFIMKATSEINIPHNLSIEINSKFVRIISTKPFEATIIEDKKVVDIFKEIFNNFWSRSSSIEK